MAQNVYALGAPGLDITRSSTPGNWKEANADGDDDDTKSKGSSRPRTYPYLEYLPYKTEDPADNLANLETCLQNLYIAVASGDFSPGVVHWTREIRGWVNLKFDMPKDIRIKLVHLYYGLSLASGLDNSLCERFASMFMYLTKRKHYLRPGKDLILDWKPLYRVLKVLVLPSEFGPASQAMSKRNVRTYTKMCTFAQIYFDPEEIPAMLEEFLPYFSTSYAESAFVVAALLNLFLPTAAPPKDVQQLYPQQYYPTFFHVWSLVSRSRNMDVYFIDIFSRAARDLLQCPHIEFTSFGIFSKEQSEQIFTAILRIFELPVGQSAGSYSSIVDLHSGLALLLDRDVRKHPIAHQIARWVVMSLSPACAQPGKSILSCLEDLINGIETFFHPSNSGSWTKNLSQFIYYLADFFVMRWNRERSGEMDVPVERRLNEDIRRRFVLALRDVVFMGIFAKSGTAINFSLSTLQCLAYLEPHLILPGALQRIYPAMQGLVEVHRTNSAIRALQVLTRIMARNVGYRCHITSLLGLALPGIDPNDLEKTIYTLAFIQTVAYNVPFHDLAKEPCASQDEGNSTNSAMFWISAEVERLDNGGPNIEIDYEKELDSADEKRILESSTADLNEFIISLLGRVFTLLKNLPDASRVRSGSPEENVVNTLPATFTPLLAALSPELYDVALSKIAHFVTTNTINQARDAVAFLCNALVKVNPQKALQRLLPELIACIRTEINENGAGSTRTIGSDILPRDQALVWHISMLSMCVVHVGGAVMEWEEELFNIAHFMQEKCQGIPTIHISNFIHHLLLNLTATYTLDLKSYEPEKYAQGLTADDWAKETDPKQLNISWYKPGEKEISFAIRLFKDQISGATKSLKGLIGPNSPITRDGTGKAWSDEVSRNLVLIRLILSGISILWDPQHWEIMREGEAHGSGSSSDPSVISIDSDESDDDEDSDNEEPNLGDKEDDFKKQFRYTTGHPLVRGSDEYRDIHNLREATGQVLHEVHEFLVAHQEDDVQCFNSLYTAYRSWFVDLGIERSAHILDRVARLYKADSHPYKFSGQRKDYPRPILVRRANVYHLQRLRYNSATRPMSPLERQLLLDLAHSSVSVYTEIRRTAQGSSEYAVKTVTGARPLIIPPLLKTLEDAIPTHDFDRIKGGMFSLLFGSLAKTIHRDWRFAPRLIKAFIEITTVDKPSIHSLAKNATWSVMEMGRPLERMVVLDEELVAELLEFVNKSKLEKIQQAITVKSKKIQSRRNKIESAKFKLSEELVQIARISHWKKATRAATLLVNLGFRFDRIVSAELVELITRGSIDPHPQLRGLYQASLAGLFSLLDARATCGHDYKRFLMLDEEWPDKITVTVDTKNPNWTEEFLEGFSKPDAKYYIDTDYQGWLFWKRTITAFTPKAPSLKFDDAESAVRSQLGSHIDRKWLSTLFDYLKQEPRDSHADRFRMAHSLTLTCIFDLTFDGITEATYDDIKELTKEVFGDGTDKHQHRATSEILAGLLNCGFDRDPELRKAIWEFVFPIVLAIFGDGLTPENSGYWNSFVHCVMQNRDPRRVWPLLDWLAGFRLDMGSNAAFKESSKIQLLNQAIAELGWHFQLDKEIVQDFLAHLDHPYKGVREAMGLSLSYIFRSRHHESYPNLGALIKAQKQFSTIGLRPYEPTESFVEMMNEVLARLETWRKERIPGQQTPSSYTTGGKTVLLWLETQLCSFECTQLVQFFPASLTQQLLHMMDVKEDPELQTLAYHVYRQLPNVPQRAGEDKAFINELIRIGQTSSSWHQRMRVLINVQVIYHRRMFLLSRKQQLELFDCVAGMLSDPQLEVRLGAQTTLSGMIKCSPVDLRDKKILELKKHFTKLLAKNPVLRRKDFSERSSTPTVEQNRVSLTRHSAVLALGALIQAFPYTSPPPEWLPETLATLATKAAGDPGIVGKGAKQILADFKKLRQDTWHVDMKVFETDQLEDLEGVLWKSYFA